MRSRLGALVLFTCLAALPCFAQDEEGFVSLFDGKTLKGWNGSGGYVVKDGAIVCDPSAKGGGNLYTEKEYGDSSDRYKGIQPWQHHGSVYGIVAAKPGHLKPVGEWNSEVIRIKGSKITVILNDVVIVDADLEEASKNGTIDGREHPGLKRTKGYICFCGHGEYAAFRNLRIKEL
jgi:hypothetical protein